MWARNFEFMFACWLALSPFIFRVDDAELAIWIVDFTAAIFIATIALVSYWPPSRKIHLANGVIGLGLVAFAIFGPLPPPPAHQNHVVLGLLLAMFCIIPSRASQPPRAWQEFYSERQK